VRCHTPLQVICPACGHAQTPGATCARCGVDFVKYGTMKLATMRAELEYERRRTRRRAALAKAVLLAPVTLGWSLLSYARSRDGTA
jgi:hypothetical protein